MIKGVFIVNNHGKPRVIKFYEHVVSEANVGIYEYTNELCRLARW